eukprot:TRINITY_DN6887_c0_g1_i1.p1 TRINITY_DN6887_c0_g1~~TRINITY_DN6887_c0_g1_i1.p1  ORF type:complete len:389 (-),score=83.35 TRINITY_DN6887_c0_g1_i1:296-1396(-)
MALRAAVVTSLAALAAADLKAHLSSLKGKSSVTCKDVCTADGQGYSGMSMSGKGEVHTWACKCSGGVINVACTGKPFIECCKDKCGGTECPTKAAGWTCPANKGCAEGQCTGNDWAEWVAAHNIYRCMHNVPPLSWNNAVFADVDKHFNTKGQEVKTMIHSKMYDVKAPAGPAGENLYQGTGERTPLDAVKAWYGEIKDCGPFPGCTKGSKNKVGHFTAMIWNGDKTIGCFKNQYNLLGCRYKSLDFLSCNTPNYGGDASYPLNVFPKVKDFHTCLAEVKKCGLPEPKGASALASIGYDEVEEDPVEMVSGFTLPGGALVALVAAGITMGFVVLGVRRGMAKQQGSASLLQARQLESHEDEKICAE